MSPAKWRTCCTKGDELRLTNWGRVTHICVNKLTIIGSDNGLSPGRRQAIIWTNAGILLIRNLGTIFSEILGEIHSFSFSKTHFKMSSAKWRLFCPGLNVLSVYRHVWHRPVLSKVMDKTMSTIWFIFGKHCNCLYLSANSRYGVWNILV